MSETSESPKPVQKLTKRKFLGLAAGAAGAAIVSALGLPKKAEAKENISYALADFAAKTAEVSETSELIVPTTVERIKINIFRNAADLLVVGGTFQNKETGKRRASIDVYLPDDSKTTLGYALFTTMDEVGKTINELNNSYPADNMTSSYKNRTGRDLDEDYKAAARYFDEANYVAIPTTLPKVPVYSAPSEKVQRYSRAFSILRHQGPQLVSMLTEIPPEDIKQLEIARKAANIFITALKLTNDCKRPETSFGSLGFKSEDIKKIVEISGYGTPFPLAA